MTNETTLPKTEALEVAARAIRRATYTAYGLTLNSFNWPAKDALFARMQSPVVGDMVVEYTTIWMKSRSDLDGVGTLLRVAREPMEFSEPWDESEAGEPCPMETVTYIATLDGREFRWRNASFLAVPMELGMV